MSSRVIISVTSIPDRFNKELLSVLEHVRKVTDLKIVVSIPQTYRKGWTYTEEHLEKLKAMTSVEINVIDTDWGPATKLLGGIEYLKKNNLDVDHIITLDDDIIFEKPNMIIEGLIEVSGNRPEEIITSGGIRANRPPFKIGDGIEGVSGQYAHAVAGFMGVIYPKCFFQSPILFSMFKEVGEDFYSEDDAYFGAVAQRTNTKIWSIKHNSKFKSISTYSGVRFGFDMRRRERDQILWNYLLDNKFIDPNK